MRGIQTPVSEIRHKIFTEIARVAYESENINDSICLQFLRGQKI